MKALVLTAYKHFEYLDVPEPQPGPEEVLVRVAACGICGSDVHGMDGSTGRRIPPIIMGHEAAGVIAQVGRAVQGWQPGDRVTFDSTISCGRCGYCLQGQVNLCDRRRVLGVSCGEFRQDGALAELVAVPQRILYRLPEGLGFDLAAMVEPVSIAVHAVRRVGVRLGDTAVVVGAGMIGLLVVQALRAAGCGRVWAIELDAGRRQLALRLGAAEAFPPEGTEVLAEIRRRTQGRGADVAIEAVGIPAAVSLAIGSVRKGGAVALVGNLSPQAELPLQAVVTRELRLEGCCASSGEYPLCLELLARGSIRVEPLISAVVSLAEAPLWFERLYQRQPGLVKVIVRP